MQRQKGTRDQDTEAGNPHDVRISNTVPQVRPESAPYCRWRVCLLLSHLHKILFNFSFLQESGELDWLWTGIITEFKVKQAPSCCAIIKADLVEFNQ